MTLDNGILFLEKLKKILSICLVTRIINQSTPTAPVGMLEMRLSPL